MIYTISEVLRVKGMYSFMLAFVTKHFDDVNKWIEENAETFCRVEVWDSETGKFESFHGGVSGFHNVPADEMKRLLGK